MDLLDIAIAKQLAGGGGGSGTDNYNDLSNLPKINDVTLSGNKSSSALGLQSEITSENKLDSDLIDDTDQDNKFVTSSEKNTWNAKQNAIDADHKLNADYVDDSTSTNKFVTASDKETWNAKQSAIDSDHKLSSSLVSFSAAEAAALASGIDSTKVAQISTNQTNILYAINTGVKNILPVNVNALKAINLNGSWTENSYLYNGVRYTVNSDGSITITRTSSSSSDATFNLEMSVGNKYVGYYLSGGSDYCAIIMLTTGGNTALAVRTTANVVPSNATGNMNLFVRSSDSPDNHTVYPMISYMNDSDYQPYALPNYDLTRLEAEDRAALVEQVDEGAKNLLEIPESQTVRNSTFTKDADDWVTSDASTDYAAWTVANSNVSLNLKAGTYIVVGISHANNTATCEFSIMDSNSTEIIRAGINYGQQETVTVREFTVNSAMTVYIMYKLTTQKCRFMICTKAKYDISPNYESHALPNTDLTQEVNALHERTDQIQPVVYFSAGEPGWYRVFTLGIVEHESIANGARDNSCNIVIKRIFANNNNEHHEIKLASIFQNMGFTDEFSKSATQIITNIRYVATINNAYIDIYYSSSAIDSMTCSINNNAGEFPWKAVDTVVKVPETTTGETVWASYDFNANYDPSFLAAKANYNVQYGLSDGSWSCSTPNAYEYTGLSITVPANQIYEIQAYDYVSNANVLGLAIGVNSTDIDTQDYTMVAEAVDVNSASHHYLCRNVSCLSALGNAKTYYLFAKHETVGANLIALMWRRIV